MAAAREVGRVSVRVVPDTDGFRRDLKRQLESIVKGVEAKINVNPDVSGFRQKVASSRVVYESRPDQRYRRVVA
ncbi:hypothetical protein, partial [Mycobacteroides abscessus]|uniref:hypothetical protein n=1 Tax=Mycobacteroides abscessus TaxID=36809 RepID=UPI000AEABB4C